MKYLNSVFALALYLVSFNCCAQSDNSVKEYIQQNAVALDTNYNSDDFKDLLKIKQTLQGRRIIALGEATHGTHDFQAIKFRIFRFLVTNMGYKLFGIEANFAACRVVNNYILNGQGDAKQAISGLRFWTWRTTDVLQMVEWMRQYNAGKPMDQKVQFFGFDMQLERYSIMQLADKLKKLDSVYFKDHFALVLTMEIYDDDKNVFTKYSKNEIDSIKTLLVNIGNYVNANKTTLAKLYSTDEIAFTERDIVLLEQCLEEGMAANNDKVSTVSQNEVRDKYMAENVQWILDHEGPDSKMMLWAHNRHIDKHGGGFSNLGTHLKTGYNDQYYAIGFDFNKGSFNAFEPKSSTIKVFTVSNSREGSSGDFFSRTGLPVFFIDIEKAVKTNSDLEKFFTKNIYHREVGGGYDPATDENKSYFNEPLYKLYNGLIFVDKTTATTLFKKQ